MSLKYKYDVAISVAEEDLAVAAQIAQALKAKKIRYYLYTEHLADNVGKPLLKITLDTYGAKAQYVLIITSKVFAEKYWAGIESQVAQIFAAGREVYVLQLRLDDTAIDGLSKKTVHIKWNNSAEDIALIISQKLTLKKRAERRKRIRAAGAACLLILAGIIGLSAALNLFSPANAPTTDLLKSPAAGSSPKQQGAITVKDSSYTRHPQKPALKNIPVKNNQAGNRITQIKSRSGPGKDTVTAAPPGICIAVTCNNTALASIARSLIQNLILSRKLSVTSNCANADKTIDLTLTEQSAKSETAAGVISTACSYQITVTDKEGTVIGSDAGRLVKPGFDKEANLNFIAQQLADKLNRLL